MKINFNLNSQGNENIDCFFQETYNFQMLENETLIITGYEDIKISVFYWLDVKLWLKANEDQHTNNPGLIFIQTHSFKSANIP